jgi:hypothetical protein
MGAGLLAVKSGFILFKDTCFYTINTLKRYIYREREREEE